MAPAKPSYQQRVNRRKAAAIAARRHDRRRRWIMAACLAALVVAVGGLVFAVTRSSKKSRVATATSSTTGTPSTTAVPLPSAAGKPCMATVDPLPAGAPAVAVQVGPPPRSLVSQDLKVGTGTEVTAASTLKVNYVGVACSTGKIFDSSYKTQKPATFALAKSIPGFRDGLVGMKVGGERLLGIPSAQGYGTKGRAPLVAPDEPLWFVIDVLDSKAA